MCATSSKGQHFRQRDGQESNNGALLSMVIHVECSQRGRLCRNYQVDLGVGSALGTSSGNRQIEESEMDWNRVEGNWKQVKGKLKERWGKLTDDDLNVIDGRRDQLEGTLQSRYGYARDQIRKEVDDWYNSMKW